MSRSGSHFPASGSSAGTNVSASTGTVPNVTWSGQNPLVDVLTPVSEHKQFLRIGVLAPPAKLMRVRSGFPSSRLRRRTIRSD